MERQNKPRVMNYLPEEMIEEILSRLPVKLLLRFRCVSKAWRSLMGSKRFIRKQLKDSKRHTHQRAFLCLHEMPANLICSGKEKHFGECPLLSLFSKPDIHAIEFDLATSCRARCVYALSLVGSCNGLVCIIFNYDEFVLWNPSTRISKELPPMPNVKYKFKVVRGYGFGCDEWSGDYKVVAIFGEEDYSSMYSLKSDAWKKIRNPWGFAIGLDGRAKLESGKLHWELKINREGKRKSFGLELDLKREVFEMVEECFWSRNKKTSIKVEIKKCSVKTSPSLVESIGGGMNLWKLKVIDHPLQFVADYDVDIYIESLETLDLSTYTDNIKGEEK